MSYILLWGIYWGTAALALFCSRQALDCFIAMVKRPPGTSRLEVAEARKFIPYSVAWLASGLISLWCGLLLWGNLADNQPQGWRAVASYGLLLAPWLACVVESILASKRMLTTFKQRDDRHR